MVAPRECLNYDLMKSQLPKFCFLTALAVLELKRRTWLCFLSAGTKGEHTSAQLNSSPKVLKSKLIGTCFHV